MKKSLPIILAVAISLSWSASFGQTPFVHFFRSLGGAGFENVYGVRTDATGVSYVAGSFFGNSTFGPASFVSQGNTDAFISKINTDGSYAWTRAIGGSGQDIGRITSFDTQGNCYLMGSFMDSIMVGPTQLKSKGGEDVFISKLDESGNPVWGRSFGAAGQNVGIGMCNDPSGNVLITGYYNNGITMGDSTFTGAGSYIAKLNSDGDLMWARSTKFNTDNGVKTDEAGNIFIGGSFSGTVVFGTSTIISKGDRDAVLAKMDGNGNFLWAKSFGGTNWDQALSVDLDTAGNPYVTGHFESTMTIADTMVTSVGSYDVFITKWSGNGDYLWGQFFGSAGGEQGQAIAVDRTGNCYATGQFSGSMMVNNQFFQPHGLSDPWITKLDGNGNFLWIKTLGTNNGIGRDIAVDAAGDCYAAGYYSDTMRLGSSTFASNGGTDGYLLKMSDVATHVSETSSIALHIYPNPARHLVNIDTDFPIRRTFVSDLAGRVLPVIMNASGQLDVSGLKPGCYILKVYWQNGISTQMLVVE